MLTVNKKDLVHVLSLIEKKAEPSYQQALRENMNREEMFLKAERCFELERQINALLDQVDVLQAEKDQHTAKLLAVVDKIKGKSTKVGQILLMVHETTQKNPRKITPQYKKILNGVLEVYDIEKRFMDRLFKKFRTITPGSTHVSKELEMQREAKVRKLIKFVESKTGKKVQLKEGKIIDWIKEKGAGLISFFESWYNAIAGKVDALTQEASGLGLVRESKKISSKKKLKESIDPKQLQREQTYSYDSNSGKQVFKVLFLGEENGQFKFKTQSGKIWNLGFEDVRELITPLQNVIEAVEKKKVKLKESINQKDYQYYVCEISPTGVKINEGFVDKEDALYRIKEQKDEGHTAGLTFKVFTGRFLKSKGIDPNDDKNWGNPSYVKDKKEDDDFWIDPAGGKHHNDDEEPWKMYEAMNRPDEQRAMGKKPVLDADEHQFENSKTPYLTFQAYKKELEKKYGIGFKRANLSEEEFEKLYALKTAKDQDEQGFLNDPNHFRESKETIDKVYGSIKAKSNESKTTSKKTEKKKEEPEQSEKDKKQKKEEKKDKDPFQHMT